MRGSISAFEMMSDSRHLRGRGVRSDLWYFEQVSVSCGVDTALEDGSGLESHVIKEGRSGTEAVSTVSGWLPCEESGISAPCVFSFGCYWVTFSISSQGGRQGTQQVLCSLELMSIIMALSHFCLSVILLSVNRSQ